MTFHSPNYSFLTSVLEDFLVKINFICKLANIPKTKNISHGMISGSLPNIIGMVIILGSIAGFVTLEGEMVTIALVLSVIFGLILFFSLEGIEVNYRKKIARHYLNLFFMRIYSDKIDLKKYDKVSLELFHELGRVNSMSASGTSPSLTKSYDIYLTNKTEKLLIYQMEDLPKAIYFLNVTKNNQLVKTFKIIKN